MAPRFLWPVVLPLSGAGVFVGHDLAYRAAGAGGEGLHGYLAHAPQLLLAVLLPALLVAVTTRPGRPLRPWAFALVGGSAFVAMEHAERLAHGHVPWLLGTPVFLLGLALQLPFALVAWWVARTLLRVAAGPLRRPPLLARHAVELLAAALVPAPEPVPVRARPRGPPAIR